MSNPKMKIAAVTEYPIESGVPVSHQCGKHFVSRYPFAEMKVGDSIFVPDQSAQNGAAASARKFGLINKTKFIARTVDGGVRIWRME